MVVNMSFTNIKECACPKKTCSNNGKCCACIIKYRDTDSLLCILQVGYSIMSE